jgi:uncharacterized protein
VVDQANVVNARDRHVLDELIRRIYEASHVQLQVLTVPSLEGEAIEQASIQVTDKWKLGIKGEDKGVLLFVAPNDHKVRIEVGQGLEGDLPDLIAHRIIVEAIAPKFRTGDISGGILLGVETIASIVAPDAGLGVPLHKKRTINEGAAKAVMFFLFVIVMLISSIFNRRRGFYGGGFGGGGLGGGGFGGGGGSGGWSGGGGGFSGGGASGDW